VGAERPNVDVVVPFAGTAPALRALVLRLAGLRVRPGDSVTVADNRGVAGGAALGTPAVSVVEAAARRSSYHARNAGAIRGDAPWILFIDADVEPAPDLLDRLFDPQPAQRTAVLAGAVLDQPPLDGVRGPTALRYQWLKASMSQDLTLGHGEWAFAQTASCAVRREAFEQVGGFRGGIRSGGDADLCFRLAAAGWELERRPGAAVLHRNRTTVPRMLAQLARHGAGAAWLSREHPGAFPPRAWPGLVWWGARQAGAGLAALARGDRDAAIVGLLDGPAVWAFELGRALPNRPLWQPRHASGARPRHASSQKTRVQG
jgi:GT2 family glycosyltransferase